MSQSSFAADAERNTEAEVCCIMPAKRDRNVDCWAEMKAFLLDESLEYDLCAYVCFVVESYEKDGDQVYDQDVQRNQAV